MENLLPAVKSISDLINDFESGKIAVPEIQQQRLRGHPLEGRSRGNDNPRKK
jgi:hypothetical protein